MSDNKDKSKNKAGDLTKSPHDNFFRDAMGHPKALKEFLEQQLPTHLLKAIDINHIELMPENYITLSNKKLQDDLICKTLIAGRESFLVIVLEHQSTANPMMAFRMLRYTCEIMNKHHRQTNQLPLVVPVVIYHGKTEYRYSNDVRDLIDAPRHLIDEFFLQPFKLVDLTQYDDEAIKKRLWSGLTLLALKRSHSDQPEELKSLYLGVEKMYFLGTDESREFVKIMINYIISCSNITKVEALEEDLNDWLSKPFVEEIMTLAHAYEQRGEKRGEMSKQRQIASRMLERGDSLKDISEVTELAIQELEALKKQLSKTDKH